MGGSSIDEMVLVGDDDRPMTGIAKGVGDHIECLPQDAVVVFPGVGRDAADRNSARHGRRRSLIVVGADEQ